VHIIMCLEVFVWIFWGSIGIGESLEAPARLRLWKDYA